MDVKCEKCSTEYSLDETLVSPSGTSVRCTTCNHVFKAYSPAQCGRPEQWQLRQVGGAIFPFERLSTLQDWIATGKVTVDDQMRKGSGEWKRLGDIAEMKPFFDAAHATRASQPSAVPVAAGYQAPPDKSEHQPTMRQQSVASGAPMAKPQTAPFATPFTPERPSGSAPMARPVAPQMASYPPAAGPAAANTVQQPTAPATPAQQQTFKTLDPANDPALAETLVPNKGGQGQPAASDPAAPTIPQAQAIPRTATTQQPHGIHEAKTIPQTPSPVPGASPQAPQRQSAQPAPGAPTQLPANASFASGDTLPASAPSVRGTPIEEKSTQMYDPSRESVRPSAEQLQRREPDLSQVPAKTDDRWDAGKGVPSKGPAWAERGGAVPAAVEDEFAEEVARPRRKIGRWIALFLILALIGAGFYMFMFQRPLVDDILGGVLGGKEAERHEHFMLKGKESFLLDSEAAFTRADREFYQALALKDGDGPTQASLALMYATWAQLYLDKKIDATVDAMAAVEEGAEPDLAEADQLGKELETKLAEARRWADQAAASAPDLSLIQLARSEIARLEGDLDDSEDLLKRARAGVDKAPADYAGALLAMERGSDPGEVVDKLEASLSAEPLLRALYRKARAQAASGATNDAKRTIERLLELNTDHEMAKDLLARIDAGKPVVLTLEKASTATLEQPETDTDSAPTEAETPEPDQPTPTAVAGGSGGPPKGAPSAGGGSTESILMRATKLQESGKTSEAMSLFKNVLARQPGNIDALSGLAYCYLDRGNKGQAIATFRRILNINGAYGPAIIGLAQTYKSMGQKAEALKWYKRYVEVLPGSGQAAMARRNIEQLEAALGSLGGEEKETAPETAGEEVKPKETAPAGEEPGAAPETPEPAPEPAPAEPKPDPEKETPPAAAAEEAQP